MLLYYSVFSAHRNIIVINNASVYCNSRIEKVIRQYEYEIRYLPFYLSDFNLIELSFSVLKAWVRRYFHELWPLFQGDFDDFLRYAVRRSRCDRFAKKHFRHSVGGYIFEADI